MFLVSYEGDFTTSNSAAVLFLWKNWHHFFRLGNKYIRCDATSRLAWESKGLGGFGEFYLTQHSTSPDYGLLPFHNYVYFMGTLVKAQTIFQYAKLQDDKLWYSGGGFGQMAESIRLLLPVINLLASYGLKTIGRTGGQIAARVMNNPEWLEQRCGAEAKALYEEYLAEETRWAKGDRSETKFFDGHHLRTIEVFEGSQSGDLLLQKREVANAIADMSTPEQNCIGGPEE